MVMLGEQLATEARESMVSAITVSRTLVSSESLDCEQCIFGRGVKVEPGESESAAEYNRYIDAEEASYSWTSASTKRDKALGEAIEGVIEGKKWCPGLLKETVEIIEIPVRFLNAGRLSKAYITLLDQDTETRIETTTKCQNQAVPNAQQVGVRFTAPGPRSYYT